MIIIGEKINATLPAIKEIIQQRDTEALVALAQKQAAAGADFIDINVGTGVGSQADEVQSIKWAVTAIQEQVDRPLCLDSADPMVLEAGLQALNHAPGMINSTKAEKASLEKIVPLAAQYGALLVALTMDESGIPRTVEDRLQAAAKIVAACDQNGVPQQNIFFDPLVMPISTDISYGLTTLNTVRAIKEKYPAAKTVVGLSNISFGLPARSRINAAFMHMCLYAGMDAAIVDPLDQALREAVITGEVLVGRDRRCRRYLRAFRD
ncbi:MAG: dihydropteroate synthase [Deltaproteobacteria bacterium]|nr:dihydropteroate synthase [Deltaproteobacteria bacterium]MBW1952683.1 dihydropteroate synthase [Deltaproteobacteria bacterium]MBW1985787.1 dihydropteroate synthase [Deltaproteobacteria bacterium]MBW2133895.1 dihydropteroate synthase [Deltaproteobacteria bacterium]